MKNIFLNLISIQNLSFLFLLNFSINIDVNAQVQKEWVKTYGGMGTEWGVEINSTIDGGYIFTALTESTDTDVTEHNGMKDIWVVKIDTEGEIEWQTCLGGSKDENPKDIIQVSDGNYLVGGGTTSTDGDVTFGNGLQVYDGWIVMLNSTGNILWDKTIEGTGGDDVVSMHATSDNGFVVLITSSSDDNDFIGNNGGSDVWVVKYNSAAQVEWKKGYGGNNWDRAVEIKQTSEGDYIIAASSYSEDGDVGANFGKIDYWVFKINETGEMLWSKNFGGTEIERPLSIDLLTDGGYLVGGLTNSTDGDIGNNPGGFRSWVLKLSSDGVLEWEKILGGDTTIGITSISDQDFIYATDKNIRQIDSNGDIDWIQHIGTPDSSFNIQDIELTAEGDIVAVGAVYSSGSTFKNIFVAKLSTLTDAKELSNNIDNITLFPNPTEEKVFINYYLSTFNLVNISLFDLKGKLIFEKFEEKPSGENLESIDISNLSNGIFILKINIGEKTFTHQLIKMSK